MTYLEAVAEQIRALAHPSGEGDNDARWLYLLYAVLALAKGADASARDVHDAWVAWMVGLGRTHESMVPFDELPPEVQDEDRPFVQAIRMVSGRLARRP